MDPYSSPYITPNNGPQYPFPHSRVLAAAAAATAAAVAAVRSMLSQAKPAVQGLQDLLVLVVVYYKCQREAADHVYVFSPSFVQERVPGLSGTARAKVWNPAHPQLKK